MSQKKTPNLSSPKPPAARKRGPTTREALVRAALEAFNESGIEGTDSNRIARRAGFAPQTFYRWFADKTEIFIAAYALWAETEFAEIRRLMTEQAGPAELARAGVAHHRAYRAFRRSLRHLSLTDPKVRAARAASRKAQIAALAGTRTGGDPAAIAVLLLEMERLADALAEGEFADMGLGDEAGERALAMIIATIGKA